MGWRQKIRKLGFTLLLWCGVALFWYPTLVDWKVRVESAVYIRKFEAMYDSEKSQQKSNITKRYITKKNIMQENATETPVTDENIHGQRLETLYRQCVAYNQRLYEQKQTGFCDPWSCVEVLDVPLLQEMTEEDFGYIRIDAMDVVLPLYVGASETHIKKGAAILGQTSLPVGGENTNAVIAAHRGYRGAAFFRDIENVKPGDTVEIHTFWGTLYYRATEIAVIGSHDSDRVKIFEGKDRITLLTCHPYRSHGKQRYVVYCDRVEGPVNAETVDENRADDTGKMAAGDERAGDPQAVDDLSQSDITRENLVRVIAGCILLVVCVQSSYAAGKKTGKHKKGR